jgi:HD-like signal output (HDOD) protein
MLVAPINASMQHLKRIKAYIARMPSLSTTVMKVLETCNNPNASPNDLNRVISLDPVLTGQVLKLINSAYYSLPHPITSLTRAIIMLGLNTVKNLALSYAILGTLRHKSAFRAIPMNDFWAHCLCVGVSAKYVSMVKGSSLSEREDYFVAGLLHDLGKIPLNKQFANDYFCVMDMVRQERIRLLEAEKSVFGFDHCLIGKMIGEKWQLGLTLLECLSCHHHPGDASPPNRPFVAVVALADIFANMMKIGICGDYIEDRAAAVHLCEQIGVDETILPELRETVMGEIEKAKIFLEISQRG